MRWTDDGRPSYSDWELQQLAEGERLAESFMLASAGQAGRFPAAGELRSVHRLIFSSVPEAGPGEYRPVGWEAYFGPRLGAAPAQLPELMRMLCARLAELCARQAASPQADQVWLLGALALAEIVTIHPFREGNGRVARLTQRWVHCSLGQPPPRGLGRVGDGGQGSLYILALEAYCDALPAAGKARSGPLSSQEIAALRPLVRLSGG